MIWGVRLLETNPDKAPDKNAAVKMTGIGLRERMLLFFGLLFVFVLTTLKLVEFFGVPFTGFEGVVNEQRSKAFRDLGLIADLQKAQLLNWINERHVDARMVAESQAVRINTCELQNELEPFLAETKVRMLVGELEKHESYGVLRDALSGLQLARGVYRDIYIVDAASGLVFVSTDESKLGADVSDRDFFVKPLRMGGRFTGDIELGPEESRPLFRTSHTIEAMDATALGDSRGRAIAVLVLEMDADNVIAPILQVAKGLGKTGEALLVNRNTRIITSLRHRLENGSIAEPLKYTIAALPTTLAAAGEEGIINSTDYRGVPVLAAFRYLPITSDVGWGMVVKRDRAEVFASLYRSVYSSIFAALAGIIVLIILATIIANNLSAPLRALSAAATTMSRGDLDVRVEVKRSDEVGKLASEFNNMASELSRTTTSIVNLNKEIAERKRSQEALRTSEQQLKATNQQLVAGEQQLRASNQQLTAGEQQLKAANQQLVASEQQLRASNRQLKSLASDLSRTEERERHRLATILHDQIGQTLVFCKLKLDLLRHSASSDKLDETLEEVSIHLGQVVDDTRILTFDLSSPVLYELGLEAAVAEWLNDEICEKHGIETEFDDDGQQKPLSDDIQGILFRNVRELLINVVKHAKARKVKVSIHRIDENIRVSVEDDGVGFDAVEVKAKAAKSNQFGLFSIRERLEQLGGLFEIDSTPGDGSKVVMTAPLKCEHVTDGTEA